MTFIVYCLKEPDTGEIRYFGKTCQSIQRRVSRHLSCREKNHTVNWLAHLRNAGQTPLSEILATGCDNFTACEIEKALIKMGRETGMRLTNLTDGGDGSLGASPSEETRKKIGKAHKGKIMSSEAREKIRRFRSGKPLSKEVREKIGASNRGKIRSDEFRVKIGLANRGKVRSAEFRAKVSVFHTGKTVSQETRKKMSLARIRRFR